MGRNAVKLSLIVLSLAASAETIGDRWAYFGYSAGAWLFAGLFATAMCASVTASLIQHRVLRWVTATSMALATGLGVSFARATGAEWTYFDFVTLVDARSSSVDALEMFLWPMAMGTLAGLLIQFGIGLQPAKTSKLPFMAPIFLPPLFLLGLAAMLLVRNGDGVGGLPPAWSGLSYLTLYGYEISLGNAGTRQPVQFKPASTDVERDIILIIDESVAGHYLDINAPTGVRSGLLSPINENVEVFNFGLAAAITNCSMGTNVTLRFGGTRNDYQRIVSTMPSVWSYAKSAGFRTVHIYAQRGDKNQNYMTDAERMQIDQGIRFEDVADIDRDQHVADRLANLINNNRKEFILVNKMGSHFPAHRSYPRNYARYQPVLPTNRVWKSDDDSQDNRMSIIADPADWRLYRNSYRNTLTWTVGAFFDRLFRQTSLSQATLIYTSDHGQTFHERGQKGLATHCLSPPEIEEGVVPLVVIEGKNSSGVNWVSASNLHRDAMSHYRIFPTLLKLMGYDEQNIRPLYGHDLLSPSPDPFTFASELHLRLGKQPTWTKILLEEIRYPDPKDSEPLPAANAP